MIFPGVIVPQNEAHDVNHQISEQYDHNLISSKYSSKYR